MTRKIYEVRTPYPSRALCAAREGFHESQFLGYLILETCHQDYPRLCRFLLERPCDRMAQTLPAMNQVSRQVVLADLLGKHVMDRDQDLVGDRPPPES